MVSSSALCDVVIERGDIEKPGMFEAADELACKRELMRELRHREAAKVSQHHEDMLVNRVYMEQVVLHLADDPAEFRHVSAKNSVLVHPSEFMDDPPRLLKDLQKEQAVDRVATESRIYLPTRSPKRSQSWRRHATKLVMLLHQQEALQDGSRFMLK